MGSKVGRKEGRKGKGRRKEGIKEERKKKNV